MTDLETAAERVLWGLKNPGPWSLTLLDRADLTLLANHAKASAKGDAEAKDATRYRWLRQFDVDSYLARGSGEQLDKAIDAAMTPEAPKPPEDLCKKCGGAMKPGKAINQTYGGIGDFGRHDVVTTSPGGPGQLIDCLKCEACGWSVSPGAVGRAQEQP